jgi:sulfatase maturation enzyme AslB (radical SAM superfamily)
MTDELLEAYMRQLIETQRVPEVTIACHCECPKNRFLETPDGEPGLNYLCAVYKAFFLHVDKPMRNMAELFSFHLEIAWLFSEDLNLHRP